jgi:hypothetical protein
MPQKALASGRGFGRGAFRLSSARVVPCNASTRMAPSHNATRQARASGLARRRRAAAVAPDRGVAASCPLVPGDEWGRVRPACPPWQASCARLALALASSRSGKQASYFLGI